VPTKKLITIIKKIAPRTKLVGFKLEDNLEKKSIVQKAKKLILAANCDWVIVNSIKNNKYLGFIVDKNLKVSKANNSREALAREIVSTLGAC